MTMIVMPLEATNGRTTHPSAQTLAVRLQPSLVTAIEELRQALANVDGGVALEAKIEPSKTEQGGEATLYWMDSPIDAMPDEQSYESVAATANRAPGTADFPKVKVTNDGLVFQAYDKYADEPTVLESPVVSFDVLTSTKEHAIKV